jgi:hypothetical protein
MSQTMQKILSVLRIAIRIGQNEHPFIRMVLNDLQSSSEQPKNHGAENTL